MRKLTNKIPFSISFNKIIMKNIFLVFVCLFIANLSQAQHDHKSQNASPKKVLPPEVQIKIALLAAPEDQREGAMVYGYNQKKEFVVLREGTNNTICLAPNIGQAGLYAYAYPKSMDPFMARGRELIAQGKRKERDAIREAEIKAGTLSYPLEPTILYGYYGGTEEVNMETGEIKDAKRRYVIYMPYATAETIGISDKQGLPGMPWLMGAGTYKAHIMITP